MTVGEAGAPVGIVAGRGISATGCVGEVSAMPEPNERILAITIIIAVFIIV
jgi:hypothetical protein